MSLDNCYFLVPARKGSKGMPLKNRELFEYTVKTFPTEYRHRIFVSTDDDVIRAHAVKAGLGSIHRPPELGQDETSMKDVVKHFIKTENIPCDATIILLYLTYPERTWTDIETIYQHFEGRPEKSLVCCEEVQEHPYLCFHEKENNKASPLIEHPFYRRQDYPRCIRLSMFVACYEASIIDELHDLMFEENSIFYKLSHHKVDVDYLEQFLQVNEGVLNSDGK